MLFYGNPCRNGVLSAALGLRDKVCMEEDTDLTGNDVEILTSDSAVACQAQCQAEEACRFFTWNGHNGRCMLKSSDGGRAAFAGAFSGPKSCEAPSSPTQRIATAEADAMGCVHGKEYLMRHGLERFVDLRCGFVCPGPFRGPGSRTGSCLAELREHFCPEGRLDFLAVDFSFEWLPPPALYQGLLRLCRPRVILSSNSGLEWWRFPQAWRDDRAGRLKRSRANWFRFEEEELYQPSKQGRGGFRLAVDRALSGLPFEAGRTPEALEYLEELGYEAEPLRRFAVYAAAAPP